MLSHELDVPCSTFSVFKAEAKVDAMPVHAKTWESGTVYFYLLFALADKYVVYVVSYLHFTEAKMQLEA